MNIMRRLFALFLGASLLLAGLGACSEMRVDTDFLTCDSFLHPWVQIQPDGQYQGVVPYWTFLEDGNLYIQEGGFAVGSCIPDSYSYRVKGKTLELLPPLYSSADYFWDKPFTFQILQCTETNLRLKLLSIPAGITTAGLSAATDIIELERSSAAADLMSVNEDGKTVTLSLGKASYYPHPSDVPGCCQIIAHTEPGKEALYTEYIWLSFCFYEDTPVGKDLKLERLQFGLPLSSNSRDYTHTFTGRMILKERSDNKAVITLKDVHFKIAHGEYILNGDLVAK